CENYAAAVVKRTPTYGTEFKGYREECDLLAQMTYARNDSIKFSAIDAWGKFAPVGDIDFLRVRAEARSKDCNNPNVVLMRCLTAVGALAARFGGATNASSCADRDKLIAILPMLVNVLDSETRNNGACGGASGAIKAIIVSTGAPEALSAFIHNLGGPVASDKWLQDFTAKYKTSAAQELKALTGQDFGVEMAPWTTWFDRNKDNLFYDANKKAFVIDARAAAEFRKGLAAARRKN
ncbi:MAG: hypothetical protein WC712_03605, partial [Candidatus Brocadiia bacterium]